MYEAYMDKIACNNRSLFDYADDLLSYFEILHRPTEKWWHSFSFYHVYKKNALRTEWASAILLLNSMASHTQLVFAIRTLRKTYGKFDFEPSHPEEKSNLLWKIGSITDPAEVWNSFGIEKVKNKERKIFFDLLQSGKVKGETTERIILYASIGCTPEILDAYKELPYSFLLHAAYVINDVEHV